VRPAVSGAGCVRSLSPTRKTCTTREEGWHSHCAHVTPDSWLEVALVMANEPGHRYTAIRLFRSSDLDHGDVVHTGGWKAEQAILTRNQDPDLEAMGRIRTRDAPRAISHGSIRSVRARNTRSTRWSPSRSVSSASGVDPARTCNTRASPLGRYQRPSRGTSCRYPALL